MFLNTEISKYISIAFLVSIFITFATFSSVIFVGDLVENSKKLSSTEYNSIGLLISLSILNLPKMLVEILPFTVLFAGMLWTLRFNNSKELLIMRSAGIPLIKVCIPIMFVSMMIGIVFVIIFTPLISATQKKIQKIENIKLGKPITSLLVSNTGFWLKQESNGGSEIIYAKKLDTTNMTLVDVLVFRFNKKNEVQYRLKADSSQLENDYWLLKNIELYNMKGEKSYKNYERLPTSITNSQIKEGFSSPETISIWNLLPFIKLFKKAGFSAKKHQLYFYKLLFFPLYLGGMALLGTSFNINSHSRKANNLRNLCGVIVGFVIFYTTKVIGALALSGKVALIFSSLIPASIPFLIGLILILYADEK